MSTFRSAQETVTDSDETEIDVASSYVEGHVRIGLMSKDGEAFVYLGVAQARIVAAQIEEAAVYIEDRTG